MRSSAFLTAFSQYDRPLGVVRYSQIAKHLGLEAKTNHERVEKLVDARLLDDLTRIHNGNVVAHLGDHAEVVRDEHD